MSKLSDAGKFYLADFKILQTVNDELDKFLDEIMKNVMENLQKDLVEPTKHKYKSLNIWENKSGKGFFELSFLNEYKNREYKDGKVFIIYNDPRQLDEYDKTELIEIDVYINSTRKPFEREFKAINDKVLEKKVFEIDLNNSENTVNSICEFISEKFYQIDKVFDILKDKK